MFTSIFAFPLEQIGYLLRFLSLSGSIGNGLSIFIYTVLCLLPSLFLLAGIRKRKFYPEDLFMVVLSAYLFPVLYVMVNPQLLPILLGSVAGTQQIGNALLGCCFYSLLTGYAILRILRLIREGDREQLQRLLSSMLIVLGMMFVTAAFGTCLTDYRESVNKLQMDFSIGSYSEELTKVFLFLKYFADALPYLLDMIIVIFAWKLLKGLLKEPYGAQTLKAAEKFSEICGKVLMIMVFVSMGWNLLQLLFTKNLYVVNVRVSLPVFSIAFVMAAFLVVQFVKENKALKDDNELFI